MKRILLASAGLFLFGVASCSSGASTTTPGSGGNNGTGRTRSCLFSDSLEQLRGTAGARQVTVRAETAVAGCNTPDSCGFMTFSKHAN